jgi:hypothetical protein
MQMQNPAKRWFECTAYAVGQHFRALPFPVQLVKRMKAVI